MERSERSDLVGVLRGEVPRLGRILCQIDQLALVAEGVEFPIALAHGPFAVQASAAPMELLVVARGRAGQQRQEALAVKNRARRCSGADGFERGR